MKINTVIYFDNVLLKENFNYKEIFERVETEWKDIIYIESFEVRWYKKRGINSKTSDSIRL